MPTQVFKIGTANVSGAFVDIEIEYNTATLEIKKLIYDNGSGIDGKIRIHKDVEPPVDIALLKNKIKEVVLAPLGKYFLAINPVTGNIRLGDGLMIEFWPQGV